MGRVSLAPVAAVVETTSAVTGSMWMPHSTLSPPDQRPARGSSPGLTARVQWVQPMLGYPRSWRLL